MHILGLPIASSSKGSACNVGDPGSIPESGRSPGEGNGNRQGSLASCSPWGGKELDAIELN